MLTIPTICLDANLINSRQKLGLVNQLEKWHEDEVITLMMTSTARSEALAGSDTLRTRKANQGIYTITPPIQSFDPVFKEIEAAVFPNGAKTPSQRHDVEIICDAIKYGAILVTADGGSKRQPGGILGNRHKLEHRVKILSPDEAVAHIRTQISKRDEFNRRYVREFGGELPEWTGQD